MAQLTCELCFGTDFVKEEGVFVCQGCGAKYSSDEARKALERLAAAEAATATTEAKADESAEESLAPTLKQASDFNPNSAAVTSLSAAQLNNYACQAFQLFMSDYESEDHPSEQRQKQLVAKAKECLILLDNAAMSDPENHLQDLLIYENCGEIVDAVRGTTCWSRDIEGGWEETYHNVSAKQLEIPGQKDSWSDKASYHRDFIEVEWLNNHEEAAAKRRDLCEEVDRAQEELSALKQEKKSLGFVANIPLIGKMVNSDAKDLVDRMKPVKQKISRLNSEIAEIDRGKEAYVEEQLCDLSSSMTRLDF